MSFENYDYYIICVSTHDPANMLTPQLSGLYDIAYRLSAEGKSGALIGIDSTVTKGTSNRVKEIVGHRLHVAHVPHRYYRKEKDEHGVKQMRVLGGCDSCCTQVAQQFYGDKLGIPLHIV